MKTNLGIAVLAGSMAFSAGAQDRQVVPDAQVESNVLRALASAPELATQDIKTTTVYGVVTLSGSATDEASRTKAEQLAARADGVKKVVDELTLGGPTSNNPGSNGSGAPGYGAQQGSSADPNAGMVLQSDGTYAPAPSDAQQGQSMGDQASGGNQAQQQQQMQEPPYQAGNAPPPPPPNGTGYPPRRAMYNNGYPPPAGAAVEGGQVAGRQVVVPSGSMVRIRINQGLSTSRTQPGSVFDGTVLSDVVADGAVAIPRGAAVQGVVVDVKDAGALKGRGELALQINKLTMGGQTYTLVSDTWQRNGKDKTVHTVNSAIGLGALGALFGAAAGGGTGAAIGAGVGAAAGVGSSAASPSGKVIIPPEAVLTFHLAQPAQVATVSEQEMSRLSYAAGPGQAQPALRRYPQPYYAPYGPYPYGR